ncbi:MAG TPA: thiamine-phosphate kinase [Bryobacteraceae bacterium]|nr:thiamine-phosphate kinase [Bryobacteraceae bacterium]
MRETEIVKRIRQMAAAGIHASSIIRGIGDDCAILRPRANEDLVFTTDFVIEGRHFTHDTHAAADVGHTALARSLSDLAAMGAEPVFCLVSLAIPAKLSDRWIKDFYRGLLALASKYKITLAGGDLSRFEKVITDVMCCGRLPRGKAMLRSAAKPDDGIYVTGELGRTKRPEPRVAEGMALRRSGVKAAIDISDGLVIDLHRFCLESGVSAELDNVPVSRGASLEDALYKGEDYELLFASPRSYYRAIRIGTIRKGKPGEIKMSGKRIQVKGFDHFNESSR